MDEELERRARCPSKAASLPGSESLEFRVLGSGFRVPFRVPLRFPLRFPFRVWGRGLNSGLRVLGLGARVWRLVFGVWGLGFKA